LLFECFVFNDIRAIFGNEANRVFTFEVLFVDDKEVANSAVDLGKRIYQRVAQMAPV
jgi:hypothetical protein